MKHVGRIAAVVGIALAIALFAREGFDEVFDLLRVGGVGLVLAASFHVFPMIANARAWQAVIVPGGAVRLPFLVKVTWMREAVNGLLPVARVGGELVAYRSLATRGVGSAPAAASLVVDVVLSMLSQSLFTLLGVVLAIQLGIGARYRTEIASGFVVLFALGAGLVLLQGSQAIGRAIAAANRSLAGRWNGVLERSAGIDDSVRAIYAARRRVVACLAWQLAGWIAGVGEIWLALAFLGHPVPIRSAIVIEVFIQTVASVAFVVPGAYGVQEGACLLIGTALGLDGATALALAATRRVRDLMVFVPGLLAWSWSELRADAALGRRRAMR